MIIKEDCFIIKCDNCGEYLDDDVTEGTPIKFSKEGIEYYAYDNGWSIKDGKHYCESCKERLGIDDE